MLKNILKIFVLFLALILCSACVIKIFVWLGFEFANASNTVFISALFATVVLGLSNNTDKKKNNENKTKDV